MVRRPRGSAALVSPCWRPGIWPVFEDQSCNFLFLCSLWLLEDWVRWIKQKPYSKLFFYMLILSCLISLSSNEHMSSWPCSMPPALSVILLCSFFVLLCCFIDTILSFLPFTSLLPSILLTAVLSISPTISPSLPLFPPFLPTAFPHSLCVALICVIAFFLPTAHPLPHKWEQGEAGEQRGRAWCRAQGTGFNEASLNEFTAFHWTTPSHVAD